MDDDFRMPGSPFRIPAQILPRIAAYLLLVALAILVRRHVVPLIPLFSEGQPHAMFVPIGACLGLLVAVIMCAFSGDAGRAGFGVGLAAAFIPLVAALATAQACAAIFYGHVPFRLPEIPEAIVAAVFVFLTTGCLLENVVSRGITYAASFCAAAFAFLIALQPSGAIGAELFFFCLFALHSAHWRRYGPYDG